MNYEEELLTQGKTVLVYACFIEIEWRSNRVQGFATFFNIHSPHAVK